MKRIAIATLILSMAISTLRCSAGLKVRKGPVNNRAMATRILLQKNLNCSDRIDVPEPEQRQKPPWTEEQLSLLSYKVNLFEIELVRSLIRCGFVIAEDSDDADLILNICTANADFEMKSIGLGLSADFSPDGSVKKDTFRYSGSDYIPSDVRIVTYRIFFLSPTHEEWGIVEGETECTPSGHTEFADEIAEFTKQFYGISQAKEH